MHVPGKHTLLYRPGRFLTRRIELAGSPTAVASFEQVLLVARELHHARIAVAVGHEEIAVRQERDVGWPIEGVFGRALLPFGAP